MLSDESNYARVGILSIIQALGLATPPAVDMHTLSIHLLTNILYQAYGAILFTYFLFLSILEDFETKNSNMQFLHVCFSFLPVIKMFDGFCLGKLKIYLEVGLE
jgi:hypothetical protein